MRLLQTHILTGWKVQLSSSCPMSMRRHVICSLRSKFERELLICFSNCYYVLGTFTAQMICYLQTRQKFYFFKSKVRLFVAFCLLCIGTCWISICIINVNALHFFESWKCKHRSLGLHNPKYLELWPGYWGCAGLRPTHIPSRGCLVFFFYCWP